MPRIANSNTRLVFRDNSPRNTPQFAYMTVNRSLDSKSVLLGQTVAFRRRHQKLPWSSDFGDCTSMVRDKGRAKRRKMLTRRYVPPHRLSEYATLRRRHNKPGSFGGKPGIRKKESHERSPIRIRRPPQ